MSGVRLNKYEAFKEQIKNNYIKFLSPSKIKTKFGFNRRTTDIYINRLSNDGVEVEE